MTAYGTLGEVVSVKPGCFCWSVPSTISLFKSSSKGDVYWSPEIHHLDNVWKLRIFRRSSYQWRSPGDLQVYKEFNSASKDVRFSLGTINEFGSVNIKFHNNTFDSSNGSHNIKFHNNKFDSSNGSYSELFYFDNLLDKNPLRIAFAIWIHETKKKVKRKDLLFPSDSLTEDLWYAEAQKDLLFSSHSRTEDLSNTGVVEARNELASSDNRTDGLSDAGNVAARKHLDMKADNSTFRKHLEDMLLSGNDHDVTIKVKYQQFRAHKCMLRARSPVFAAMFKHKMRESADNSISIDDCDPESFDDFLHYVYTDEIRNLTLSNAMGLYYAGDKYDISGLKKICVEFLKTSLSTTTISDVITLAIKHREGELLKCATSFFADHLEEIMITVEWQHFLLGNPIQANELCLKAVKTAYKKVPKTSGFPEADVSRI